MAVDSHLVPGMARHGLPTWSRRLIAFSLLGALVTILVWGGFTLERSSSERTVIMAVYPEGSLNAELVKRYQEILARKGINVRMAPSSGAAESIARLGDEKSGVNVALVPGGVTSREESPQLVSLGTLFYQPVWLFSRGIAEGQLFRTQRQPGTLRISIGPQGSGSRVISLKLLGRAGLIDKRSVTLFSYGPAESADKLISGEIDMAVIVDGWDSPAVQQLLKAKGITLESMPRADAFAALYPYLTKLILPAGVLDILPPRPPKDVTLISTKSSLIVRQDMHSAVQYTLLEAAVEIHSTAGIFRKAGQFPAPEAVDLPLSPLAREFYKSGTPFMLRYLPFWLAVLLGEPIVWLIPAVVILIPIFRLAPTTYNWLEQHRIYRLYVELKRVEDDLLFDRVGGSRTGITERLNRLEERANRMSVPTAFKPLVYSLRLHINLVRQEAAGHDFQALHVPEPRTRNKSASLR